MSIIFHDANGSPVAQRRSDGYLNATSMCKAHQAKEGGKRREVSEWLSNDRTKETLKHLSEKTGLPVSALTERVRGVGTWLHPRLAVRFGIWLDDDFGFMAEEWIASWMTTGENPIARSQPLQPEQPAPALTALPPAPGWSPENWESLPPEDQRYFAESPEQRSQRTSSERKDLIRFLSTADA